MLITSDTLLPAALVWDSRHGVDAWANFQHPRVPSFIPDLLVFGAVQGITDHWRLAMAVWVLVMVGGLTVISGLITARVAPCAPRVAVSCVLSVLMVVLGAAARTDPRVHRPACSRDPDLGNTTGALSAGRGTPGRPGPVLDRAGDERGNRLGRACGADHGAGCGVRLGE